MKALQRAFRLVPVLLLLASTSLSAQSIAGRVTDAADGAPIPGATVVLLDAGATPITQTATAEDGTYELEVPSAGSYIVLVQLEGAANQMSSTLEVAEGQTLSYDLSMNRQAIGASGGAEQLTDAEFIAQYMAESCDGLFTPGLHGILFGAVRNEGSGEALSRVKVTARWTDRGFGQQQARETRSDETGFWFICNIPAGQEVLVRAQSDESNTEGPSIPVTMRAGTMRNLDVEIALSDPNQTGNLIGYVRDVDNNRAVIGATVRLRDADRTTTTNGEGLFILNDVPSGLEVIEIDVLGYQPIQRPIQVYGGRGQQLEVLVSREAFELDPIVVTVRPRSWFTDRAGLEQRRAIGAGHFIMRDDIEERVGASNLGDLMRGVPGVRVRRTGGGISGNYTVQLRQAANLANEACAPQIWMDGISIGADQALFAEILPWNIEAVEVYRGASEVPGEFSGGNARCGVIVVWTRRGFGLGG